MSKLIIAGCDINPQIVTSDEPGLVHRFINCATPSSPDLVVLGFIKEAGLRPFRTDRGGSVFLFSKASESFTAGGVFCSKYIIYGSGSDSYTLTLVSAPAGYHLKMKGAHDVFKSIEMLLPDWIGERLLSVEHESEHYYGL